MDDGSSAAARYPTENVSITCSIISDKYVGLNFNNGI